MPEKHRKQEIPPANGAYYNYYVNKEGSEMAEVTGWQAVGVIIAFLIFLGFALKILFGAKPVSCV